MIVAMLAVAFAAPVRAQTGTLPGPALVNEASADSVRAFPPAQVRAWQVGLLRPDRLQHAGLSFALGTGLTLATRDPVAGAATALALGALKELWDTRHGGADGVDLLADAVGAALGAIAGDSGRHDPR